MMALADHDADSASDAEARLVGLVPDDNGQSPDSGPAPVSVTGAGCLLRGWVARGVGSVPERKSNEGRQR